MNRLYSALRRQLVVTLGVALMLFLISDLIRARSDVLIDNQRKFRSNVGVLETRSDVSSLPVVVQKLMTNDFFTRRVAEGRCRRRPAISRGESIPVL